MNGTSKVGRPTNEAYQEEVLKLSKTSWLVIAIGILVVVGIGLGMVRSQQVDEQSELNEKLALAKSNLERVQPEKFPSQQAELEERLYPIEAAPAFKEDGSMVLCDTQYEAAKEIIRGIFAS